MSQKPFSIIVAHDLNLGIGIDNTLPWKLAADMAHFKKITTETKDPTKQNVVIMGRNTYESLPEKFRPLPNRYNIILSRNATLSTPDTISKKMSLDAALEWASNGPLSDQFETLFVIGGATLYKEAIKHPRCEKLIVTKIHQLYDCDAFFPPYTVLYKETWKSGFLEENDSSYSFSEFKKSNTSLL